MTYKYTGIQNGRKTAGVLKAENAAELRTRLRELGVILLTAAETKARRSGSVRPRLGIERACSRLFIKKTGVEQAFRELVILLKGDVAVVEAFETVVSLSKGLLAQALFEVAERVKGGSSLTRAMRERMPFVGALHLGLVEVGEANGSLPQMFTYSTDLMEQQRKMRNQILQAMTYPAIVVVMGLGVGYYVSVVAIPQIASVMGSEIESLTAITRSLLSTSDWVRDSGYWLVLSPVLLVTALFLVRFIRGARVALDYAAMHVPLFGKVGRFSANALFNKTLALLIDSGISVVESLDLIRNTIGNGYYQEQVRQVRAQVLAGKTLSTGMELSALKRLSPLSYALVRVGENSGNMDEGLRYVGAYYEDALARRLDMLGKLVEPALIIVVGGMVAYVYIAFFMGMAAVNTATL
jgi:type II secretory pathway component PulF